MRISITISLIAAIVAVSYFLLIHGLEREEKRQKAIIKQQEEEADKLDKDLREAALDSFMDRQGREKVLEAENNSAYRKAKASDHKNKAMREFFNELESFDLSENLEQAKVLLLKMERETEDEKKKKIERFYNRYLPLMSEVIVASKTGESGADNAISLFSEIEGRFYKSLYS